MIKAVIFDAGGVIVDHSRQLDVFISIFRPADRQEFWKKLNSFAGPLCRGEVNEKDYWTKIALSENVDPETVPDHLWARDYEEKTVVDQEMIALIKKLRRLYKTMLVTNTIAPHVAVNRKRGLFDVFDQVICSNQVHLTKHSPEIFRKALKTNSLKPEECVFIDDTQEFLDVAGSIGIAGILFKNITQLKKELANMGIKLS